ncbi:MAG: DUF2764 family protein [Planctomycetota bacterium]|jgi:hypothetical protein
MKGANHYYITALPALDELGSKPPLQPAQLLEHVTECLGPRRLIETLFLLDDLLQREAFLAGEIREVSPVVLTPSQARNEDSLPAYLVADKEEVSGVLQVDDLWDTYFRHAGDVARQHGSLFLAEWVGHEVALRNSLAAARARRLELDKSHYLIAVDLADNDQDFTALLSEWTAAPTPLEGLRVLIKARWAWLAQHDAWFTFGDDELAAYAAKLMLLHQWRRFHETHQDNPAANQTNAKSGILERMA